MTETYDENAVSTIIKDILDDKGMRLYELQYNHVAKTLRVFIDREGGGVTIADCEQVSQLIRSALQKEEMVHSSFTLEVSSPGIERPLKRPEHYSWAIGKMVELDVDGTKLKGYLRNTDGDGVTVATGDGEQYIAYKTIIRAKVVEDIYGR